MERKITFYRIVLYVDDGTNVDYIKPKGLSDTDVFINYDNAWEWCQDKDCEEDAIIKEETDDILNIGEYHFVDIQGEFNEALYKLKTIGSILKDIEFCIVESRTKMGTMTRNGFFYDSRFYGWKTLTEKDKPLMEKILDYGQFDIKPLNSYSLNMEQKSIVDEIFRLVEQASSMDIGFYYDLSENKMFAFNADNVVLINPTIKKSNARLTNDVAEGCEISFHGHYDSSKQSIEVVNKSH